MSRPFMSRGNEAQPRMNLPAALRVLVGLRQPNQVVVTSMGAAREWTRLSRHPLDFHYVPSTMGGAVPFALGVALAQPQRHVLVCSGDGSLLMNLGCLVTVVASGAGNLTIVLLDNGAYEVTGGQKTAAACAGVDYAAMARAAGFRCVAQLRSLRECRRRARRVLELVGPRFVWLQTELKRHNYTLRVPPAAAERLTRLQRELSRSTKFQDAVFRMARLPKTRLAGRHRS